MAAASETKKLSLKLLVDSKTNKVMFAEADKSFVDFLCDILSIPINTMVKLLKKDGDTVLGSLGNIYKSIEALGEEYMMQSTKDLVLKPRGVVRLPLLSVCDAPPKLQFYCCSGGQGHFSHSPIELCPSCCYRMKEVSYDYVAPRGSVNVTSGSSTGNGYAKEVVKFMVLDNLEIKPLTTALIKCHAKNIAALTERDVEVGYDEGLAMLKASFETQAVLTTVFLGN